MTASVTELASSVPAVTTATSPTLVVIAQDLAPHAELRTCLARFAGRIRHYRDPSELLGDSQEFDAAIVVRPEPGGLSQLPGAWNELVAHLAARQVGTLVLGDPTVEARSLCYGVSTEASADELIGRIDMAVRCRSALQETERELARLKRLGDQLSRHFEELDQEMRLAGRLQRDFLPRDLPRLGRIGFEALYRPATWVSGDIYDVFRLDEVHIGFYLADAVGHGVAAGLLTMFIKRSMVSKEITNGSYRIIPPPESLGRLNDALAREELPNCQFVTAIYGIINSETLELTISRGGHPYPIHVDSEGTISEIKTEGGLLGVFAEEEFPQARTQLAPGDKVILYSDGLEEFFVGGRDSQTKEAEFGAGFAKIAGRSGDQIISHLRSTLDIDEGSLSPADDITVVILEIASGTVKRATLN